MKKIVYLLSYDHGGYVFWKERFYEKLSEAEMLLKKYPDFKIGLDNESFAYEKFAEADPKVIEKIKDMLKRFKGRFGIGASTYGQPLSVFSCEESNIRQLTYAIRTNIKIFGVTPPVYAVSEHALHSQLPQILNQTNYKQAIIRTHFMMYGYNPTVNASYCKWIGDDGSCIAAVPTYDGEGARFAKTTVDNWFLTRWPDQTNESPEDFINKFSHIEPLLASRYDDLDLRCEKMIEYTVGKENFKWVILEDLQEIYKNIAQVPFITKPNDFIVRMPWGYCGGRLMRLARLCENNAITAERCDAAAYMLTGNTYNNSIEKAWKNALIVQHHDIQICGLTEETEEFSAESINASNSVIQDSVNDLAQAFERKSNNNIIIFNPLDREVTVPVKARIQFGLKNKGTGFAAICGNEKIPCELDYEQQRKKECICGTIYFNTALKPFSAKCFAIIPDNSIITKQIIPTDNLIETDNYKIELDKYGIKSIYHKRPGRYISKSDNGMLFKGVIDGKEEKSEGKWFIYPKKQFVNAMQIGNIGSITYKFSMTVYNCSDRIECSVTFSHHGEKIGIAEELEFLDDTNGFIHENKLRFALPIVSNNAGMRDLPFVIAETNDKYIQGNYWTGIKDEIAYINKGAMCAVRESDCFSLPLEYSNDYVWGKRILFGDYEHEFAFIPYENTNKVHLSSYEYNHKPVIAQTSAGGGQYSDEIVFISADIPENALTTALYCENDAILLRIYETEGKNAEIKINSNFFKATAVTNLLGNETDFSDGNIKLNPKEIKTIKLTKK